MTQGAVLGRDRLNAGFCLINGCFLERVLKQMSFKTSDPKERTNGGEGSQRFKLMELMIVGHWHFHPKASPLTGFLLVLRDDSLNNICTKPSPTCPKLLSNGRVR